ncbi:hypothetical protein GTP27_05050 [Pseudoduganella sp. CY13W]|uniref:FecR protein domain-containing protein n=2 Tax=Duganella qianjiadongensis TaxID=2692176 RepID=A0ABW9VIX2_9BURK|nr:hypothetical protein [Duganella qianjiadongensis]
MRKLLLLAGCWLLANAVHAAEAGKIIFVAGAAKVASNAAVLNAPVNEGEMLSTGADGYIYIKTIDDGLFILRPNTQARIASYHIDSVNPANTRIKLELISGVARSQSGQAVKLARQNFRFNTPVAAIGVRGTDFTVSTDNETSRVTVLSGGITMSGFANGCRPEGTGPCEGAMARELSAAQKGQLLQLQRGQAAPQLLQGNTTLAPDLVAPPRSDEPGKPASGTASAPTEPSLDLKKDQNLQQEKANQKAIAQQPSTTKPSVPDVVVTPPEVIISDPVVPVQPVVPPKEVSWGRYTAIADQPATSGLSKAGAERLGMTEDFVLFRSRTGSTLATPVQGSAAFALASGEAYIRNIDGTGKAAATLQNGVLAFDFGNSSFSTQFDLLTQNAETYKMASAGRVTSDGLFSSQTANIKTNNMSVTGALNDLTSASYIFQGTPDSKHVVNGVTNWKK